MFNIKANVLLILFAIIYGCNFFPEKSIKINNTKNQIVKNKLIEKSISIRNVTDSVLHYMYPDSSQIFFKEEKSFFSVYKYSKNNSDRIYYEVLKSEFELNDSECSSRFKKNDSQLIPHRIDLDLAVFNDGSIKYNSYPGTQKVLFFNKKSNLVSLYLSDSLVIKNDKIMNIFINIRDKVFISEYKYDSSNQLFIKKSEKLFKEIK